MRVNDDRNQISEDVFDFKISYLPFPQKSIRSELAELFSISIDLTLPEPAFEQTILLFRLMRQNPRGSSGSDRTNVSHSVATEPTWLIR